MRLAGLVSTDGRGSRVPRIAGKWTTSPQTRRAMWEEMEQDLLRMIAVDIYFGSNETLAENRLLSKAYQMCLSLTRQIELLVEKIEKAEKERRNDPT